MLFLEIAESIGFCSPVRPLLPSFPPSIPSFPDSPNLLSGLTVMQCQLQRFAPPSALGQGRTASLHQRRGCHVDFPRPKSLE